MITKKYKAYFVFVILVLFIGCSDKKSFEIPEHIKKLDNVKIYRAADRIAPFTISLISDNIYTDTKQVLLGPLIKDIAVDEQGQVYMADYRKKRVHVYNPDGSFNRSIGREGKGPGEFQMIWDIEVLNNELFVLDYGQSKISVFDVETSQHRAEFDISLNNNSTQQPSWINQTQKLRFSYSPTKFYIKSDGNYLIIFSDEDVGRAGNIEGRTYEISLFNPRTGNYLEHELFSFKWSGRVLLNKQIVMFNVPYKRSSQFDYFDGQLVYGWTEALLFKFFNEDGTYQRTIYYPQKHVTLTKERALSLYKKNNSNGDNKPFNAVQNDTLPETWPAFNSFLVDDEKRLWVSVFTDQPETYEWWVLAESGKLLGRFNWPRQRDLKEVKNGYAYTLEKDEETGLQQVVRYRIEMEKN